MSLLQVAKNVASILDVPYDVLPDTAPRLVLLGMAAAGVDTSAYLTDDSGWHIHLEQWDMTATEWTAKFAA